jgi:hypothetical protein
MDKDFVQIVGEGKVVHIVNIRQIVHLTRIDPEGWSVALSNNHRIGLDASEGEKLLQRLPGALLATEG